MGNNRTNFISKKIRYRGNKLVYLGRNEVGLKNFLKRLKSLKLIYSDTLKTTIHDQ